MDGFIFNWMFWKGKILIELPSYFNVFDVDKLHFKQISDILICMTFWHMMQSEHTYLSIPAMKSVLEK